MSDRRKNSYGEVGRYFVLYLDVQGIREQIFHGIDYHSGCVDGERQKQIEGLTESLQRFLSAFAQIAYFVKGRPSEYYEYLTRGVPAEKICALQKDLCSEIQEIRMGVQQFSDSTLIYVRDTGNVSRIIFEQCMARCAYEMVKAMGAGIYIRGAMSCGTGWELMPNCLFGPVIQEVYDLEQHVANTFRVVVTPAFYDLVRKELGVLAASGCDMSKPYPFKMIGRDPDGVLIFDYLSDVAIENFKRYDDSQAVKIVGGELG